MGGGKDGKATGIGSLNGFGDGKGGGEGDRRDASLFDDVGERTHGARAERSNGGEKDDIDTIRRELGRGRWAGVVNDRGDIVGLVPSKRDMTISNRADRAVRRQLLKSIEREHDIVVEHESASVEVGAPVAGHVVATVAVEDPIARVHRIEVVLVGMVQRRRRDEGHGGLRKRTWCRECGVLDGFAGEVFGQSLDVRVSHESESSTLMASAAD